MSEHATENEATSGYVLKFKDLQLQAREREG